MVIQMPFRFHRIDSKPAFDGRVGKNIYAIVIIQNIIGDMFNDRRGFLIVDESGGLENKFFRVVFELVEYRGLDPL